MNEVKTKKVDFVHVVDAEGKPLADFAHPVPSHWIGTDLLPEGAKKAKAAPEDKEDAPADTSALEARVAELEAEVASKDAEIASLKAAAAEAAKAQADADKPGEDEKPKPATGRTRSSS